MFVAYFDASGTERNNPVLAVAGFLSGADRWMEFETKWLERLKSDGLTCFHTSDFNACQGEFKSGWKGHENRRVNLIADLVQIIKDHVDRKFGAVIIIDSLRAFSTQ